MWRAEMLSVAGRGKESEHCGNIWFQLSIKALGGTSLKDKIIKTERDGETDKIKTDAAMSQSKVLPVDGILKGF